MKIGQKLQKSNVISVREQISHRGRSFNTMCVLNAKSFTSVSSDLNNWEALMCSVTYLRSQPKKYSTDIAQKSRVAPLRHFQRQIWNCKGQSWQ